MTALHDIQNSVDTRNIAIERVGIKNFKIPAALYIEDKIQHTVANVDLYTDLAPARRGTHMSRFIALLTRQKEVINPAAIKNLLTVLCTELDTAVAELKLTATVFLTKTAPVSQLSAPVDYQICLSGKLCNGNFRSFLRVEVAATSLCPCSKEISAYGAHNQRSLIIIDTECNQEIPAAELIHLAEQKASCELFSLLKRPDEKYVTERAYMHPKFVEDIVRDIYQELKADSRISRFRVSSENFESIHNHSAFAQITYPTVSAPG